MRRAVVGVVAVSTLLVGSAALACGGSFGANVTVDPHQDIIIRWKNGIETYVFQPTFCGTSAAFGLILPVPAALTSEPALFEQGAFSAAVALSEPNKHEVSHKSGGIGCGGMDSKNASLGASDNGAAVVASGRVGILDWTQLKADSTSAFTTWLDSHGYPYAASASSTFAYYVEKGWYFLAFRIGDDSTSGSERVCQALGPVALSFPTAAPVVPSRMAAASSSGGTSYGSTMRWRIFGITSGESQLSLEGAINQSGGLWYSGAIGAADAPRFAGLAAAGDRLTRLILTFYSSSATADASLVLAAPQDYRGTEDVMVEDSSCSVRPSYRVRHSVLLPLFGLALLGLICRRRWR